ncbi:MAG TPA: CbtA family protein [Stellaceae bacterium]|jgi:cobalt transporter subunit CbtA|nr:CbtA family protein [Stellaceae bacterium]
MFRRIFLTALLAGAVAGLFAAGVQQLKLAPLIAAAEVYEAAEASAQPAHQHDGKSDPAEWEPSPGWERTLYTLLADTLTGVGFALILTGCAALARLRGYPFDASRGMLWGAAGFAVFALSPTIGLPPELPGMVSAALAERQQWWLLAVVTTASGLALIAFVRLPALRIAGVVLLLLPHLIGAPQGGHGGGTVPPELAAQFATASLATAAAFWLLLGAASGWLYRRFESVGG